MIRVALPRGDLREPLAERLDGVGFRVDGYGGGSRSYRFEVKGRPGVAVRVFSDRDIPIQVALGQYDLGVTSLSWVDELQARYGHGSVLALRSLDVGASRLVMATARDNDLDTALGQRGALVVTEYPNLTTRFLNHLRAPHHRAMQVWGNAHAWPPDDAEAGVISVAGAASGDDESGPDLLREEGLAVAAEVHRGSACLVANRRSLRDRDLRAALDPLLRLPGGPPTGGFVMPQPMRPSSSTSQDGPPLRESLRIAVPDGHAHRHTVEALAEAGIEFVGYDSKTTVRRPVANVEGIEVKVIRPQDMPQAVALGQFDLALTGRDWLNAHQSAFPSSPVVELADLYRSRYQLGAVVDEDLPAGTIGEAVAYWRRADPHRPIRIASEYAALADQYGRDRHIGRYSVIPIYGASEGFVPEDAEILIEGSETGTTLRANRLRMIDVIMESTNCAIGSATRPPGRRGELRDALLESLRALRDPQAAESKD